jgi:hypothetical protein
MSVLTQNPSALQAEIAAGLVRLAALREQQAALQDALTESSFPELPYDDPAWSDPARWEPGPAIPTDARLVPSDLDLDAELAAYWPGSDS